MQATQSEAGFNLKIFYFILTGIVTPYQLGHWGFTLNPDSHTLAKYKQAFHRG